MLRRIAKRQGKKEQTPVKFSPRYNRLQSDREESVENAKRSAHHSTAAPTSLTFSLSIIRKKKTERERERGGGGRKRRSRCVIKSAMFTNGRRENVSPGVLFKSGSSQPFTSVTGVPFLFFSLLEALRNRFAAVNARV